MAGSGGDSRGKLRPRRGRGLCGPSRSDRKRRPQRACLGPRSDPTPSPFQRSSGPVAAPGGLRAAFDPVGNYGHSSLQEAHSFAPAQAAGRKSVRQKGSDWAKVRHRVARGAGRRRWPGPMAAPEAPRLPNLYSPVSVTKGNTPVRGDECLSDSRGQASSGSDGKVGHSEC